MSEAQQKRIMLPSDPLVEVWRGPIVESRHGGHIVAVDGDSHIVARLGEPEIVTYLRSSAKPHQAFPLVAAGAAECFGFTDREIAVACGSHSGEPVHEETVAAMLRKIGLAESALKCGIHEPFSREVAQEMKERGERPRVLQNNCSGKHTGMLALALHLNATLVWLTQVLTFTLINRSADVPVWYALTVPLGTALFAVILLNSMIKITSGRGVTWKGRQLYERSGVRPPSHERK